MDTQQSVLLSGITIDEGTYVEIDLFTKRIMLNGSTSVRSTLNVGDSRFFSIPPGGTVVRLLGENFNDSAHIRAITRGAYGA